MEIQILLCKFALIKLIISFYSRLLAEKHYGLILLGKFIPNWG